MQINTTKLAEVIDTGYRAEFKKETIPKAKKEFSDLFGGDINIIIDWESFDNEASIYEAKRHSIYWVESILKNIIREDDDSDLLKKKIESQFTTLHIADLNAKQASKLNFSDGKLSVHADWENSDSALHDEMEEFIKSNLLEMKVSE